MYKQRLLATGVSPLPWWRGGGIPLENCVGAYSASGSPSQLSSYVSLVRNGIDAIPVNTPSWDSINGWKFNHTLSQYIKIPITIQHNWSFVIKFSNITGGVPGDRWICGTGNNDAGDGKFDTQLYDALGISSTTCNWNDAFVNVPRVASGTILVSSNKFYANGHPVATVADSGTHHSCISPYFGVGTLWDYNIHLGGLSVHVQRIAFYNIPIDQWAGKLMALV